MDDVGTANTSLIIGSLVASIVLFLGICYFLQLRRNFDSVAVMRMSQVSSFKSGFPQVAMAPQMNPAFTISPNRRQGMYNNDIEQIRV